MKTQTKKQQPYLTPAQLEKRLKAFRKEIVELQKDVIEYLEWKSYGGDYIKAIEPHIATPEIQKLANEYRSLITKKSYEEEQRFLRLSVSKEEA